MEVFIDEIIISMIKFFFTLQIFSLNEINKLINNMKISGEKLCIIEVPPSTY